MTNAKGLAWYCLVCLLWSTVAVRAGDTLDGYLAEAARNNPGVRAAFNEYMAALEQAPQVGTLPDAQVAFGYFVVPVETRVGPMLGTVSASQMFPWFGTLGARKDAATAAAKSRYEAFGEAQARLFFNVRSMFYNLYLTQKSASVTADIIAIVKTLRAVSLTKVESGEASSVDVLRADMEIADLENHLALLGDAALSMQAGFDNLLSADARRPVVLPDTLESPDFGLGRDAILDSIRHGNHQILQSEFTEASYRKKELAARRTGLPSFALGANYTIIGKSSNPMTSPSESGKDAFSVSAGITLPLYRGKYSAMVKEAVLMQQSTADATRDKINALETSFENANKDYSDAGRRIPLFAAQADRARRSLAILRTGFETNGKSFDEVLEMERRVLQYELELEKARSDKAAAIAFIKYLMGK